MTVQNDTDRKFPNLPVEAEQRIMRHFPAMVTQMSNLNHALRINVRRFVWVLPESEWDDIAEWERPDIILGCPVKFADVSVPMIAAPVRSGATS